MDITTDSILEQIKAKETDLVAFAKSAQEQINEKQQALQAGQAELQNLVKALQKEVDKREGAIEALNALLNPQLPDSEPETKQD